MRELLRIPLDGGGWVLVEREATASGPVRAGRAGDIIAEATASLGDLLKPITDAAQVVLTQLRAASPDEVEVEFGVDLSSQAGAVIAKTEAGCHLTVKVTWQNHSSTPSP